MSKYKPKHASPEMHEELKGIFLDVLKGPEEREGAFAKLRALEATSNIIPMPLPKEKKEAKQSEIEQAGQSAGIKRRKNGGSGNVKKLLALYREYESEINGLLGLGGNLAVMLTAFLSSRKTRRPRKRTK